MNKLNRWWRDAAADYVVGIGIAIAMTALARLAARAEQRATAA